MLMALFATSKELVASVGCEEGVGCGGKRDLMGSVSGNMICFFFSLSFSFWPPHSLRSSPGKESNLSCSCDLTQLQQHGIF